MSGWESVNFFQDIYTCTETGAGKDRPKIYQLAAEALQARPEEILVFEDALYAIRTAAKAGFVTVGVEDPYNAPDKEAIRETADYYTEEFGRVSKVLGMVKKGEIYEKNSIDYSRK
mgnify:CR=1 FL=1